MFLNHLSKNMTMITNVNNEDWDKNDDTGADRQSTNQKSLEEQEQLNSDNLAQRVEEENAPQGEYSDIDETIDQPSQAEEDLSGFLERNMPDSENMRPIGNDRPLTKNLLGDNPPGSEQAAFEAGNVGDASADQFTYDAGSLGEALKENLEKTEQQINLDKRLKDDFNDSQDTGGNR